MDVVELWYWLLVLAIAVQVALQHWQRVKPLAQQVQEAG